MLYILLIIIAIGVLLCSEPGKKLLGGGVSLLLIGGILLLVIGGGWLILANFKELSITALCLICLGIFIAGIMWAFNGLEQIIRKAGNYPADDKELPWCKPTPSAAVSLIVVMMAILFCFVLYYMIKNHSL